VLCRHFQFLEVIFTHALDNLRTWGLILRYLEGALDVVDEFLNSLDNPLTILNQASRKSWFTCSSTNLPPVSVHMLQLRLGASLMLSSSIAVHAAVFAGAICFVTAHVCQGCPA
jgi:hypothetical protein